MAGQCNETFDRIARDLGDFGCRDAPPVMQIRDPLELSNATLPVIEALLVVLAVAALVHSVQRLRRHGDPVDLALWSATVIYLFVIEIPLYFPNLFAIDDILGVAFVHNVFTVQFLFDRLPLYIVALYPAMITLSYEIVRSLGVFRDRGVLLGAVCVGFVHHCLYEVFDQLGPALRWWAWNTENPLNRPMLASVPMTSIFLFATLGPVVVTVLVLWLVGRKQRISFAVLTGRTVVAGVLTPVGLVVLALPTSVFGGFGGRASNTTAQAVIFALELAVVAVIASTTMARQWRRLRRDSPAGDEDAPSRFVRICGPLYLAVLGILWAASLPAYFRADAGVTVDGTPVGSLTYAVGCFTAAAVCLGAALTSRRAPKGVVHQRA